ncbi:RNA polymerase sigma factor [Paenibacillus silvisoli]|uniref:RNA polymerase sigma factor n=1 Tax=Paenibacillus silvisoli TaxID=3110539 RepID=UPI0028057187|nr:RNA polymerase sigma factor [Paenibacillus silvisoli]
MELELTDGELIARAQGGDRDAFGELVRRHRSKAFDWARGLARDPHLAEDIVQEALLRAFMHLGSLADMERFLPWLHRIVRNEALMKLRKGEHSGRERTFTGLQGEQGEQQNVNWADLDSILVYMCNKRTQAESAGDPSGRLANKEFLETIRQLLHCLTPKERAVFEAHFFGQLSPAEIAGLFRTTTDNVYQSLARARTKVREERTRLRLLEYVREKRGGEAPDSIVLPLKKGPGTGEWKRCKTSFAGAVYGLLPYLEESGAGEYSLTDVMGLTGQAFRLTVEERHVGVTGPTMYFWEPRFRDGLLNLGLASEHAGDGGLPPTPFMLNKGIACVRGSIARGMPVIAWDSFTPEFGIVYGYDDKEELLYAEDSRAKRTIPYERFGRGLSGGLFVLSITGAEPVGEWEAVRRALAMAVRHAYGELTFVGYACGLAAYRCWIDAFRRGSIDPLGNAYTAAIAAEVRGYASSFLRGLERKLDDAGVREASASASAAALQYEIVAEALGELSARFPFPKGGTPDHDAAAASGATLLERALAAEKSGIAELERLCRYIDLIVTIGEDR